MDASLLRPTEPERARAAAAPLETRAPTGRRSRYLLAIAIGAIALGIALRFLTTGQLWLDEALTVNISKLPLGRIPDALRHDGSPPLYYFSLHFWMEVFGSGDVAVRALSGMFAVASLPLMWLAGKRVGGRACAWAAVLLLVSSPFAIRYGTEARMYSLLGLLTIAGFLVLHSLLQRPSVAKAVGVAVLTALLLLTHYWSLYLIAATGVLVLVRFVRLRDRGSVLAIAGLAGGFLLFLPWLPIFAYQMKHTGTPWARRPTFAVVIDTVRAWAGGGTDAGQVLNLVTLVLAGLAVFGIAVDRRRIELDLRTRPGVRGVAAASLGTLLLALVAAVAANSAYVVRYTAAAFPLFVIVIAFGTLVFADRRVRRGIVAGAVLLGFIAVIPNTGGRRTEAGVVAAAINREAQPGDLVAYCPDQVGPSVSRLVKAPVEQLTFPAKTSPEFVDWVDYQQRNEASRSLPFAQMLDGRAGPHRIWLVWSPGYRTFGARCTALVERLEKMRPDMKRVVKVKLKYEEHMGLIRYEPVS